MLKVYYEFVLYLASQLNLSPNDLKMLMAASSLRSTHHPNRSLQLFAVVEFAKYTPAAHAEHEQATFAICLRFPASNRRYTIGRVNYQFDIILNLHPLVLLCLLVEACYCPRNIRRCYGLCFDNHQRTPLRFGTVSPTPFDHICGR